MDYRAAILLLSVCALLLGNAVAEDTNCNATDLPTQCEGINVLTLDGAALLDSNFGNNYCGDTCGQALYTYFKECEANSTNATKFDVYCARAEGGNNTCSSYFGQVIFEGLLPCSSVLETQQCTTACSESLLEIAKTAGCCLPSLLDALLEGFGQLFSLLCGINNIEKCDGFFTEMPAPPGQPLDNCDTFQANANYIRI